MPTKINTRTVEQYERIGCGTFDNRDGCPPSISFQVHWVQDDANGIAQFMSVSRTITVMFDASKEEHVAIFSALRALGLASLETPV